MQPNGQTGTRSDVIVTELMVLAGEAVGLLGAAEGIPLPYRSQPRPSDLPADLCDHLRRLPRGPCRTAFLRRFFPKGKVGPVPAPHWALGVAAYVQWTSPIRRALDLAVHRQIKAWIASRASSSSSASSSASPSRPAFPLPSASAVKRLLNSRQQQLTQAAAVSRRSDAYWLTERLRRGMATPPPEAIDALVLSTARPSFEHDYSILLLPLGTEVTFHYPYSPLQPGDVICVEAAVAEPRAGKLTLIRSRRLPSASARSRPLRWRPMVSGAPEGMLLEENVEYNYGSSREAEGMSRSL